MFLLFEVADWTDTRGVTLPEDGNVVVRSGVKFGSSVRKNIVEVGGSQMLDSRCGDGEKFFLECRPICFDKLSAGADLKKTRITSDYEIGCKYDTTILKTII